jgi:HPt (histidine-containing phosphotransfer) domain-containing protein
MATDPTTPLSSAIQAVWQRSLPQTRERIALLQRAAAQLSESRSIDTDLRAEALTVAHKLAGSLGMFGFSAGTEEARAIEAELSKEGLPQPERLQSHVDALAAGLSLHEG